jgi:hypothetical protein
VHTEFDVSIIYIDILYFIETWKIIILIVDNEFGHKYYAPSKYGSRVSVVPDIQCPFQTLRRYLTLSTLTKSI